MWLTPERDARRVLMTAGVVVVVLGVGIADTLDHSGTSVGVAVALSVLRAGAVFVAARRPLVGWWLTVAACLVATSLTTSVDPGEPWPWSTSNALTLAVGLFFFVAAVRRRVSLAAWAGVQLLGLAIALVAAPDESSPLGSLVGTIVVTGLALIAGDAAAGRRIARRRIERMERENAVEHDRRILLEERSRLAYELHDVVAHHMSVISVQADSAPYRIAGLNPDVEREFAAIADGCRSALADLRRMLDMLRSEPDAEPETAPNADLSALELLAENVRRVGLTVDLSIEDNVLEGNHRPEVELVTYRVIQEALSNVVRHAPRARVSVAVVREDQALRVSVVNGPGSGESVAVSSDGHGGKGLAGMRERLRTVGGTLDAAPTAEGGFALRAVVPTAGIAR